MKPRSHQEPGQQIKCKKKKLRNSPPLCLWKIDQLISAGCSACRCSDWLLRVRKACPVAFQEPGTIRARKNCTKKSQRKELELFEQHKTCSSQPDVWFFRHVEITLFPSLSHQSWERGPVVPVVLPLVAVSWHKLRIRRSRRCDSRRRRSPPRWRKTKTHSMCRKMNKVNETWI